MCCLLQNTFLSPDTYFLFFISKHRSLYWQQVFYFCKVCFNFFLISFVANHRIKSVSYAHSWLCNLKLYANDWQIILDRFKIREYTVKNSEQPDHLVCYTFPILASLIIINLGGKKNKGGRRSEHFLTLWWKPLGLNQLERVEIHTIKILSRKYDSSALKPKHQPLLPRASQNSLLTYFVQFHSLKRVIVYVALLLKSLMRKEIMSCLSKWLGQFYWLCTIYVRADIYLKPFHSGRDWLMTLNSNIWLNYQWSS